MTESLVVKSEFKVEVDDTFQDKVKIKNENLEEAVEIEIKPRELSPLVNTYDDCEVKEETQIISERQRSVWDDDASDENDNNDTHSEINIFELIDKYSTYKHCIMCKSGVLRRDEKIMFCPKCFDNKSEEYICDICNTSMKHKGSLIRHIFSYHYEKRDVKKDMDKYLFECDICNKRYRYKASILRHIISHNPPKPFKCDQCNQKFAMEISLAKHLSVHRTNRRYICTICSVDFDNEILCRIHIRRKHNHLYKYNEIENLIETDNGDPRSSTENDILNYKCDVCSKIFCDKSAMTKHLKKRCFKKYSCTVCGKRFSEGRYLKYHMITHTGEGKQTCYICNKSYTKLSSLQHHIKHAHSGSRPFKCDSCNLSYVTRAQLKRHRLGKHTQQPQFVCDICKQCFRYNSSLKRHMIVHTGGFRYDCKYCYKYFMLKPALMLHIKEKHGL